MNWFNSMQTNFSRPWNILKQVKVFCAPAFSDIRNALRINAGPIWPPKLYKQLTMALQGRGPVVLHSWGLIENSICKKDQILPDHFTLTSHGPWSGLPILCSSFRASTRKFGSYCTISAEKLLWRKNNMFGVLCER